MIKIYNITVKGGTYKAKDGTEKNEWNRVGKLIEGEKDGKAYKILKLFMYPNLDFGIFEDEKKDAPRKVNIEAGEVENVPEDITTEFKNERVEYNGAEIPF